MTPPFSAKQCKMKVSPADLESVNDHGTDLQKHHSAQWSRSATRGKRTIAAAIAPAASILILSSSRRHRSRHCSPSEAESDLEDGDDFASQASLTEIWTKVENGY